MFFEVIFKCMCFLLNLFTCLRFCAHEYEKFKDMASAALAYKCVEVAYLRVIYSSHSSVSKDRHELQTALQIVPPGKCLIEYLCVFTFLEESILFSMKFSANISLI